MANRVLVASKSCRAALDDADIIAAFAERGMDCTCGSLSQCQDTGEYQAVVIGTEAIGSAELDNMPKLRVIHKFGVGLDNIDVPEAESRGIAVMNMPGVNSQSVAEMTVALMMAAARRVAHGDRHARAGQWLRLKGVSLSNKVVGIVGTGAIGVAVAKMLAGFGVELLGYDAIESEGFKQLGGRYVKLSELMALSDFITIHLPLNEHTRGLIGREQLAMAKDCLVIVNTARGGIVDEDALEAFLISHPNAAAGLDVLAKEPPGESGLLKLENAVITPHIAASDDVTPLRMFEKCLDNLHEFFKNG